MSQTAEEQRQKLRQNLKSKLQGMQRARRVSLIKITKEGSNMLANMETTLKSLGLENDQFTRSTLENAVKSGHAPDKESLVNYLNSQVANGNLLRNPAERAVAEQLAQALSVLNQQEVPSVQ
eukprot:gnl/Hemi2/20991_TR6961_c0_g1_i1.p2 gnl/Hemi2/20991_TR6961_c0_g1~~gnl/Hemi2/20991_TR6961_c0_g1_i1.p2  ORF type:complete len:122 (-),score=19.21 gnl/Hemi2/20991_TR6961_c0_g1_i1:39-404(-)